MKPVTLATFFGGGLDGQVREVEADATITVPKLVSLPGGVPWIEETYVRQAVYEGSSLYLLAFSR